MRLDRRHIFNLLPHGCDVYFNKGEYHKLPANTRRIGIVLTDVTVALARAISEQVRKEIATQGFYTEPPILTAWPAYKDNFAPGPKVIRPTDDSDSRMRVRISIRFS